MKNLNFLKITIALSILNVFAYDMAVAQSDKYQRPGKKEVKEDVVSKNVTPADKQKKEIKSEKVDLQDIENQYWQQKDQDFHVVQNRRYSKEKRYFISPTYGILINDSFTKGGAIGVSGGYYLNEQNGLELSYLDYSVDNSKTTDEVLSLNGTPSYTKMVRQMTATYNWMPIYGKISLFDKSIIYFDMGINVGLGLTTFEKQIETGNQEKTSPTLVLDITQQFFIKDNLAIRFDIRNRFYKEERVKYDSTGATDELTHSLSAGLGVVFYFGSSPQADQ